MEKVSVSLAKKGIAYFLVLELYIAKKHVLGEFFFRLSRQNPRTLLDDICIDASSAVSSARKLKFWLPASFEPTWCTYYP
jgi:hypothetical protein